MKLNIHALIGKIEKLENWLSKLFFIIAKPIAIFSVIFTIIPIAKSVFDQRYIIEPLKMPMYFEESGMTGDLASLELSDQLNIIMSKGWSLSGLELVERSKQEIVEDVVIFDISLNSVKALFRYSLGIENKSISGTLFKSGEALFLSISVSGENTITLSKNLKEIESEYSALTNLTSEAALLILHKIDPFVLASYYWSTEETTKSIELAKEIIHKKGKDSANAFLLWGEILNQQGEYNLAIEKFQESLKIKPTMSLAYNAIGNIHLNTGEYSASIEYFRDAVKYRSNLTDAWFQWGAALYFLDDYKGAIRKFNHTLSLDRNYHAAYNEMSYAYANLKDMKKAEEAVMEAITLAPDNPLYHGTLAEHLWSNNKRIQAFKAIEKAAALGLQIEQYQALEPYSTYLAKQENPIN